MKTNKVDTEQAMRGIDILHMHIKHILVLMIELGKTIVNQAKESQVSIQGKRLFVLEQSQRVQNWVNTFEPQNVNVKDLTIPDELKLITDHTKRLVNSPSRHQAAFATTHGGFGGQSGSRSMLTQNSFNRLNVNRPSYGALSPSNTRMFLNTTIDAQSDVMNAFIIGNGNIESQSELKTKLKAKRGSNLPQINTLNAL